MPSNDHNEQFDNLEVEDGFTDPAGVTHTGELADLADTGQGGVSLENTDGTTALTTNTIHLRSNLTVEADGDGTASIDAVDTDTHVTVENTDGTALLKNPDAIQAGANCSFTDDGDNTVTLDVDTSGGSGSSVSASDTATASGDGTTTTFTVTHSLGTTPTAAVAHAASDDASPDHWVSGATSTTVDITYASAPSTGTDNLQWHLLTHTSNVDSSDAIATTKSGDGTTASFTFSHDLAVTPTAASVQATSEDASADFWVSGLSSTGVTITYAAPPPSGTSNLSWQGIVHE